MRDADHILAYQFLKLHFKLIESLQVALRPEGLTVKNFSMMQLIESNSGINQNELAKKMQKDKTLMVQVIDKLEKKGLATREPSENDRRAYALSLTPAGKKIVEKYAYIPDVSEEKLLSVLDVEDQKSLRRIMNRLIAEI
ncbi:MarR family winged helix-turn-helix transcriptional regulator [Enterococcus timonensis]|uniref:MarR family winged helix-turn-helix transcriptional regulator n=1 Tax=Enterococcus timonensis TaxID=1852364 RepID=UPI0008D9036F|nr:MarR family transcriptional regulator [Enterococcus timonensis]